jgi:3-oxoacyl-[acyl-carrier protein] reductase
MATEYMMKTVLITGAAGGIGSAIARRFAEEPYRLALCYHHNRKGAETLYRQLSERCPVALFGGDLSSAEDVDAIYHGVRKIYGGVDILINNAGTSDIRLYTDYSHQDILRILSVNLMGAMLLSKVVLPGMVSARFGRIINIGSMWGQYGASCEVPYSSAKAGIVGFTKALAKEAGPSGVTVNCVSPGLIDTPMNRAIEPESLRTLIDTIPVGRMGTPEEVAEAVFFFASEQAGYINGQVLGVDGGI